MASAWPEPASVRPAGTTAGVLDGVEAFAFRTTETEKGPGEDIALTPRQIFSPSASVGALLHTNDRVCYFGELRRLTADCYLFIGGGPSPGCHWFPPLQPEKSRAARAGLLHGKDL